MLETITGLGQILAGGDVSPAQQVLQLGSSDAGFFGSIPYEKFWDQIMIAIGAVVASVVAWWKSLGPRYQVAIALAGVALVAVAIIV